MKLSDNYTLYIGAIYTAIILSVFPYQAQSQEIGIPYNQYLQLIGLDEEGSIIKEKVKNVLREHSPGTPDSIVDNNAEFFSTVLVLSGITPETYNRLEQEGVDIIHAITADSRPFSEQSLLVDLVVTGMVTSTYYDEKEADGFDFTVEVTVDQFVKGNAPSDTVKIRQHAEQRLTDTSLAPELGQTYLLLLSSGMYGYRVANYRFREVGQAMVSAPVPGQESEFIIYRMYPVVNGRLVHANKPVNRAISEIEEIHKLQQLEQD